MSDPGVPAERSLWVTPDPQSTRTRAPFFARMSEAGPYRLVSTAGQPVPRR